MSKKSQAGVVYCVNARATWWDYKYSLMAKLEELIKRLDFSQRIESDEYVAALGLGSKTCELIAVESKG